jgi:predicted permease
VRLFRLLLAVLPREFRARFGAEMLATARALEAERPRRPWRTLRGVVDAVLTPISLHAELRADGRRRATPRGRIPMEAVRRDLQFAARALRREPGFTLFCCVTLALGIGANAAMFGIADRLLLTGPHHVHDARRVVRIYATTQPQGMREFTTNGFGQVTFDLLRQGTQTFASMATYAINEGVLGAGADARTVNVGYASAGLFPLLGVQPLRGRFFTESDDLATAPARVAVLSAEAWRAWFGGQDALDQTIVIGDERFTIIGVAPPGFTGPQFGRVDVWVPGAVLGSRVTTNWQTSWNAQWLQIVGRLRPGVSFEQSGLDATAVRRRGYTGDDRAEAEARFSVASLRASESGTDSADLRVLQWLIGVSALVLLTACANIANLLLARGMRRSREVAVRAALGAGRLRLVRLLLLEALLLAAGGAALGLGVAYQVGAAARRLLFTSVEWSSSPVNLRVLAISALIAVATTQLIGLIPAIRLTRTQPGDALKTGVREGGGTRSRLRAGLTIVQAALSVVLLIGAGLFVRSLWRATTLDLGFDADRVTVVEAARQSMARFPPGPARDAERTRRRAFYCSVLAQVRALPGVEQASVAVGMPFGNRFSVKLRVPGLEIPRLPGGGPGLSAVADGYFDTMGTRILRGRAFTADDHAGTEPIAIVSALMADVLWPSAEAIGHCLLIGDGTPPCARIVGVAANTYRSRLGESPVMHYYIPAGQEGGAFGGAVLVVRSAAGTSAPVAEIRRLLSGLDATITYVSAQTVRERIEPQLRPWKLGASVFLVSGVLALVVSGLGMFSVMSYLIADRRREIGVRLALGAQARDVIRLVLRGSLVMACLGVAIGEAVAAMLGGLAAPLLFSTSPRDPVVFASVALTLLAVAVLATLGPAWRARQVNPVEALRAE